MRGKHANAAKNRRDRAELEQRADRAGQQAERLEKELAQLRESSQRQMSTLRSEISQVLKDRDNAAAPALSQAEERIRALMVERDQAIKERKDIQEKWNAAATNLVGVLRSMGLTSTEAMETLFTAIEPDGKTRTVNLSGRDHSTEQLLALDRAQGHRHASDPLADRRLKAD